MYVFGLPVWRDDSRNRRDQIKRLLIQRARVEIVINQLRNDNKRNPQIKVSKMRNVSLHTYVGCKWSGPGKNRCQQYDQVDNNDVKLSRLATRHRHRKVVRVQHSQPHPWQTVDALLRVIACRTECRIGGDKHTVTEHECVLQSVRTGHPRLAAAAAAVAAVAAEQFCLLRFFRQTSVKKIFKAFCNWFLYTICYRHAVRLSVCRLSSATFVYSTQAIEIFGNISTPFGTLVIHDLCIKFTEIVPGEPPPRRGS